MMNSEGGSTVKIRGALRLQNVVVLNILFLSACGAPTIIPSTATPTSIQPTVTATSRPYDPDTFPSGILLDCPNCSSNVQGYTTIYYDDGTLTVYNMGEVELTGKWYVEGDTFYEADNWCNDEDTMPSSYKWHFDGELLTFTIIKDDCADRRESLIGNTWRVTDPIMAGTYVAGGGEYTFVLGEDQNFTFTGNGAYNTSGTFALNGNEFILETDGYCDQKTSWKATYFGIFVHNELTFNIKGMDACIDRMRALTRFPFVKVK